MLLPCVTFWLAGVALIEKSLLVEPPTIGWERSQRLVSLDQLDCIAKVPVPIRTLADAP